MLRIIKSYYKKLNPRSLFKELQIKKIEQRMFINEMNDFFQRTDVKNMKQIEIEYLRDMKKYMFSFNEWYSQYNLTGKSDKDKRAYISCSHVQKIYRTIIKPEWRRTFHEKNLFLLKFKNHIHRRFLIVTKATPTQDIINMLSSMTCIVKPMSGSLGRGIFKVSPEDMLSDRNRSIVLSKITLGDTLIEECIEGCEAIQKFHLNSLNTIRIVTIRQKTEVDNIRCLGAFIRFGKGGSIVDNAHAGGIFAHIDIALGKVDSDGLSTDGKRYHVHPDSGILILGFQIPQWNDILNACIDSHRECPNFIIGWDVVINSRGQVEFIEGNHAPDVDLMQSTIKKGLRDEIEEAAKYFRIYS